MLRLKCCQSRHEPIELPDRVDVILGRSPQTKIMHKACSRQQVQLTADYNNESVTLKQLGPNPSHFRNEDIAKGESRILGVGDVFYFFADSFPYEIVKEPDSSGEQVSRKRTIDSYFGPNSGTSLERKLKKQKVVSGVATCDSEDEIESKLNSLKGQNPPKSLPVKEGSREIKWEKSETDAGWSDYEDMLVYHSQNLFHSSKIAGFDMDGTLITTASGRTFAKDHNDWKILYSEVPGMLKKLHKEGFKIVIITNQLGIGRGKVQPKDFKTKVENVLKKLGAPAQLLALTKRGPKRKPNLGSWTWLEGNGNGGICIDMQESFYVGDAAGRPKDWAPKRKKDFSCTDRLFALNLGIAFKTPEEFFLSQGPAKFNMPEFDPKNVNVNVELAESLEKIASKKQELVLMVGYPASGKSFFSKYYLASKGYVCVSRDTMKTWQKCVSSCNQALSHGKCVVVDNTNADKASRERYIECAKSRGCDCRCFVMQVSMEHARHNNRFRELSGSDHDKVPDMVFYQYRKNFEEPKLDEGFSEIVKINFVPKFENEEMRKTYQMYTD